MISPSLLQASKAFQYLSYDTITSMDHKMYTIDLDIPSLFHYSPDNATVLSTRTLKASLPKCQKRYLTNVMENFKTEPLCYSTKSPT